MSRAVALLDTLGIECDPQLFELALTHRSYAYENGGLPHNERLEFLGDSVLSIAVTEFLYLSYPDRSEGQLAKLRSAVVNAHALADVARDLELGPMIRLGKGEVTTGGFNKSSILADTFEAFLGAVHLSAGREASERLVHYLFDPLVDAAATAGGGLDWKTSLQELCATAGFVAPLYLIGESGPDHDKRFVATAIVDGQARGQGAGRSKKQAEQIAAREAVTALAPPADA
ncbi:MAG: ribonuclease III [Propionibacteriaceae bacterium]|nr:ribonuclease III [Micropruina sp.]HBX82833.1 ribonuclease III [Propionibacteriaceae bacterium]HBY23419.1 ribonuclease III [Propionibacteriaceae bacterium]